MQKRLLWMAVAALLVGAALHAQEPPERGTPAVRLDGVADPPLGRLVEAALREHPQVLAAEAALERERALARAAARPVFNPELELDVERADTDDASLRITQTLDVAGVRAARSRVADGEVRAATRRLASSRRDLAVEVLSTLGEYWTASELATLAERRFELLQRVADVAEQRARVGDATQADVNLASLARVQARMDGAGAAADLAAAEMILRALVAEPPGGWPRLPTELPPIAVDRAALERLVAAVPEVELQQHAVEVAEADVGLRERERRPAPSVSLVGGEEDDEPLIGVGFSMPLNVRNRFAAEVDAARAERVRAEREADDTTRRALAAAEAATARYTRVRDAWLAWLETGVPNLTQQTELLERLWRTGELSLTEYLVQVNQTLDTQQSALELRRELWDAWFAWLAATGQTGAWLGLPIETAAAPNDGTTRRTQR
ncbi:MAG TPA: TolC family protein [Gammaproteobacteria bacterium]